jgi:hypothetical protein
MDDGLGGNFTAVNQASLTTSALITTGILRGSNYRFRYRAYNEYGWSPYSDIASILVAQPPDKPVKVPVILQTNDTHIDIRMDLNISTGGSPIS